MKIDFGVDIFYIINLKKHKTRKNNIVKLLEKYEITNYEFMFMYFPRHYLFR